MPDDTDAQKKEIAQVQQPAEDTAAQREEAGAGTDAQKKEAEQI